MKKILEALLGPVCYLTTDLENGTRATDLAMPHDMRVEVLFPRDLPVPPGAAALIVDLDHLGLTAHERREWLVGLKASPPGVPTFVHTFDHEDGPDTEAGVVGRRLDDRLLRIVAASLDTVRTAAA